MIDGSLERVVVSNEYHSKTRLCSIIGGWEEKGDSSPRRLALKDETHTLEANYCNAIDIESQPREEVLSCTNEEILPCRKILRQVEGRPAGALDVFGVRNYWCAVPEILSYRQDQLSLAPSCLDRFAPKQADCQVSGFSLHDSNCRPLAHATFVSIQCLYLFHHLCFGDSHLSRFLPSSTDNLSWSFRTYAA
ncbi:hypothetical protein An02g06190 [Aspergillus niger]|uniref:Uncharacterized protein n=2 Tax=Aspergillus niger TaxID=5061 RepID=A2QD86_ASPNC|nr:hypothetical protein An02g06190 [Aspergillus niger]CAK37668.1 hypothetical protein An02g06190 [Aspergillus niger]